MSFAHSLPARAWRFARWLLIVYLVVLLAMLLFENHLIFVPSRYPEGDWRPPGLAVEDAWFTAADGVQLHGWYLPHPQAKAAVLLSHGNGGNVTHRAELLQTLHRRLGVSLLIYDYRGYGRSAGRPNERGILLDARAARAWLAQREGLAESDIVQMGESLGGAVAVDLAAADGARGLILDSAFNRLPDVAAWHFPWFPVRPLMRTQLDAAAKIGDYRGPLMHLHGDRDRIVPIAFGQRLFERANEPKQFVVLPGGDHNDPRPKLYYDRLAEFIAALPPLSAK